jgi:hypothetical protein
MLTVAVSVTLFPAFEGLREDVIVTAGVPAASLIWCPAASAAASNDASPS